MVMHHVAVDDNAGCASRFAPSRIIDRLVVAVVAQQRRVGQGGKLSQILHGGGRLHAESEHGRIWRHHQVIFLSALQGQRRYAKSPVLIDIMPVERAESGFRDAPRHAVLLGIGNLTAHGIVTGAIEQ